MRCCSVERPSASFATLARQDVRFSPSIESKQLLKAYDIPTVETRIALTEQEALQAAEEIGYPIVLKLYSLTITHKTDVGGVQLNLRDANAVKTAFQAIKQSVTEKAGAEHFQGVTVQPMVKLDGYELIIGSSLDSQFGPVILFGTGGQLVEVFKDSALALPPLNSTLALRMMEQTKILKALKGRARAQAGGYRRTGGRCWCASASWWSSSAGSRRLTSIRCWLRRSGCWRWMRAWSCTVRK